LGFIGEKNGREDAMINHKIHIMIVLIASLLFAQQRKQNVAQIQNQLQAIQKEISGLEKHIKTEDNRLKIETKSIINIDKQISLTHQQISIFRNRIRQGKETISSLENQIDSLQSKIQALQKIFKQQVVFAYKYQRGKQYDWLLGASNFNEIFIRYSYFKKVADAERNIFLDLNRSQERLQSKEKQLAEELKSVEKSLSSAKKTEVNLNSRRKTKTRLVNSIKKNKNVLSQALQEQKESYDKLKNIIATLEKRRPKRQLKVDTQVKWEKISGSFSKNRGKFNWPVQGSVLHGFGRFKNPELKTVLNNTGIDIKAPRGQGVRCVFPGVVSMITYMSGFGNTVIVDHNDGYYTVYAHLDQILVNAEDFIEGGMSVGTVGESGSLEGPKLHFEIYGSDKNLNPLKWLKKK
jgi:septal ring factor EnvC (AmiA/AmiB activator)